MSRLTHLECSPCGKSFDFHEVNNVCDACGQPLLCRYDLKSVTGNWKPGELASREATLWRYGELLPVQDEARIVSLGETMTMFLRTSRLGPCLGLDDLLLKDETRLPTGTFKARGMAMAVTRAVELGVKRVAVPTAGNAGEAMAVYAARAGLECFVFMPKDAPQASIAGCQAAGARVFLVEGLIGDAGKIVRQGAEAGRWFDMSTFREPYRVEGKKTMGFELAEQLDWSLPDVIIYPTGGGTGLVGMWKAFDELEAIGGIGGNRPRMVSVQSEGCAPIVRAFSAGAETAEFWEGAKTVAPGLRVPKPFADRLILKVLRDSNGTAVAVSDAEIIEAMPLLAHSEGVLASPESAATTVAARHLAQSGWIKPSERVVLFICGTLLKHLDLIQAPEPPLLDPHAEMGYETAFG
ncbi:MAG: threonine synthase [bacterium]